MTILPPKHVAQMIGLSSGGIMVLQSNVRWAHRDRFAYCIEALIDIEIAYKTDNGYVIERRETLVNAPISRIGGLRARLTRSAALLTAVLTAAPTPEAQPVPIAA